MSWTAALWRQWTNKLWPWRSTMRWRSWIFRGTILFFCCLMRPATWLHAPPRSSYCIRGSSTLPAWRTFCTTALRKCAATSNKLIISLQKSRRWPWRTRTGTTSSTRSVHHHSQCSLVGAEYHAKNLVKVREIVSAFEGDDILVSNAKAAVNDPNIAKLFADYQVLPQDDSEDWEFEVHY